MSRNFIPAVLAIGMGVVTGYYTFQPALRELQIEKDKGPQPSRLPPQQLLEEKDATTPNAVTVKDPDSYPEQTWEKRIPGSRTTPGEGKGKQ